jgi:sulfur carrier protein ThiS
MKRVTIADAPASLNTNDKAMWVLGFNDAVEGMTRNAEHRRPVPALSRFSDAPRMRTVYPEVPGVEVLLNGRPLPREEWAYYAVQLSDLLDAKSGTRTITYLCNGILTIQLERMNNTSRGEQ